MKTRTTVLSNGYTFHALRSDWQWTNVIRLPEIKTADLSTYRNFSKCHQALFHIPHVGLRTRLYRAKASAELVSVPYPTNASTDRFWYRARGRNGLVDIVHIPKVPLPLVEIIRTHQNFTQSWSSRVKPPLKT